MRWSYNEHEPHTKKRKNFYLLLVHVAASAHLIPAQGHRAQGKSLAIPNPLSTAVLAQTTDKLQNHASANAKSRGGVSSALGICRYFVGASARKHPRPYEWSVNNTSSMAFSAQTLEATLMKKRKVIVAEVHETGRVQV